MGSMESLKVQTQKLRAATANLLTGGEDVCDQIPPTWKNNLRWHVGHLVITPRLLTLGLLKEDLGVPEEYRRWFAKGTSPADWGDQDIPSYNQLLNEFTEGMDVLFKKLEGRELETFSEPYTTSVGVVLTCPSESLVFSQAHDGIHLGMILALKRALNN